MIGDTSTPFDLKFRFLGFPCTISVLFWVGAVLLSGANLAGQNGFLLLLIWIVALLISILVHELGHAFAARTFGSRVHDVRLTMLGGYCAYDRQPQERWKRIAISLAGPGAGFLLWGLIKGSDLSFQLIDRAANASPYLAILIIEMLFINFAWSLFNLLPILPLDGGHVSEELCEGARVPQANITARWIGVVTAVGLILFGFLLRADAAPPALLELIPFRPGLFMMIWMAMFALNNYQEIQQLRAERGWGRSYGYNDADPWR